MTSDTSVILIPAEADEIQEKLDRGNEHRRNILSALASADSDSLNTSQIRERADAPSGSMNHYLTALADWGVLEETGEREYSQGGGRLARYQRSNVVTQSDEYSCDDCGGSLCIYEVG